MKKIYELKNKRKTLLDEATAATDSGNLELYNTKMTEVTNLNAQIDALEALEKEEARYGQVDPITDPGILATIPKPENPQAYHTAFCAALRNKATMADIKNDAQYAPLLNALTETGGTPAGSDGGFFVPEDVVTTINSVRRYGQDLSAYFNVVPVTALKGSRVYDTHPTAGFTALDEMDEIPNDDQPKFTKLTYTVKDYALFLPVSNDLLNDETANLLAYLSLWLGKKAVLTKDKVILDTLKTLPVERIEAAEAISALKTILNTKLDVEISLNSIILTNQDGFDYLANLTDTTGRPMLQPDPTNATVYRFSGRDVVVVSNRQLPSKKITTAGNTKGDYYPVYVGSGTDFMTLFIRKELEISMTTEGGKSWGTNSTELRAIMRMDKMVTDTEAMVACEIFIPAEVA